MSKPDSTLISVVAPIYCEEDALQEFYERTTKALATIDPPVDYELIFVNDGSTDRSLDILRKLAATDPALRVVNLSRNFGHQAAITSGIDHANGDAIVVMDADLQDPPETIVDMVDRWREGCKVVHGVRTRRSGETRFKLVAAKAFYRVIRRLSDTPLAVDSGDFRLLDRQVVLALRDLREGSRYIRGLVCWLGFSQCSVEYERDSRYAGTSKFRLGHMIRFALDGITSFSEKPLRIATQLGLTATVVSLLLAGWVLLGKILSPRSSIPGYTTLMVVVLFIGGAQLVSLGLLGEYLGRVYRETKHRPLYVVAERVNFESDAERSA